MFNLDGSRAEVASSISAGLPKADSSCGDCHRLAGFLSLRKRPRYCWWRGTTGPERINQFPGTRFDNRNVLLERDPLINIPE